MPAPKPPEFRRRAVDLARLREQPIAQIAKDLGIVESGLRRRMTQALLPQLGSAPTGADRRQAPARPGFDSHTWVSNPQTDSHEAVATPGRRPETGAHSRRRQEA